MLNSLYFLVKEIFFVTIQGLTVGFLAVALVAGCGIQNQVMGRGTQTKPSVVVPAAKNPQILVKFRSRLDVNAFSAFRLTYGLRNISELTAIGIYVEEVTSKTPVADLLKALNEDPAVEYADLNGQVSLTP
jgi:hypothetical protein